MMYEILLVRSAFPFGSADSGEPVRQGRPQVVADDCAVQGEAQHPVRLRGNVVRDGLQVSISCCMSAIRES
jgi:hypothetical protein